jgi:uncharacterized RDD family membrane protein YckC
MQHPDKLSTPRLWRRLMAIVYDSFLVIAIVFVASIWMPLIPELWQKTAIVQILKLIYILCIVFCFFAWFWTHGGQTLGMRAWKIRLYTNTRHAPTLRHALIRYLGAWLSTLAFGLGFIWALFDRHYKTWHDYWSDTYLELVADSKPKA